MTASIPAPRTAYDELADPAELRDDCLAAEATLGLHVAARTTYRPAPSIRFEEQPIARQQVALLAAADLLAQALNLESD